MPTKIEDIDFDHLMTMVSEPRDFNKLEVRKYLGLNDALLGEKSVGQGLYMTSVMDVIDEIRTAQTVEECFKNAIKIIS